jgi:hypothetical protein
MRGQRSTAVECCRSCNVEIIWARAASGQPIALDAAPTPLGMYRLGDREDGVLPVAAADAGGDGRRYTSHRATCLYAATWLRGLPHTGRCQ